MASPIILFPTQTVLMDPVSSTITYSGKASSKSLTSDPVWQISKFVFDSNRNLLSQTWANGNGNYENVWDNRAALTYA